MARLSTFWDKMFCFALPKRSKRSSTKRQPRQALSQHKAELQNQDDGQNALNSSAYREQARRIAATPVCGMRRTAGPGNVGYMTSYQTTQGSGLSSTTSGIGPQVRGHDARSQMHDASTNATLVGDGVGIGGEKEDAMYGRERKTSTWQGRPNGTAYDKRQELTEEDEDMWARLAM